MKKIFEFSFSSFFSAFHMNGRWWEFRRVLNEDWVLYASKKSHTSSSWNLETTERAHMKGWWSATLCWQLHPSQESWNFHRDEKARPRFHPIMWDTSQSLTFNLTFAFNSIAHTSRLPLLLRGKHSTRVKTLELGKKKEGTVKCVHSSREREKREEKFKSC